MLLLLLVVRQIYGHEIGGLVGIRHRLDHELALGGGDSGDQRLRGTGEGVAPRDGADSGDAGDRGVEIEAVDVDELAELEAVGEDEIGVFIGEGDVGGVEGVGELDVETLVGPEVGAGEGGDDADDLKEGGAVVAGDFGGGVHGLEKAEEDSWSGRCHCCDL